MRVKGTVYHVSKKYVKFVQYEIYSVKSGCFIIFLLPLPCHPIFCCFLIAPPRYAKFLIWQNSKQLFDAQEFMNSVKSEWCGL